MKKLVLVFALAAAVSVGAFAQHPNGWGAGLLMQNNFSWSGGGNTAWWGLSLKAPQLPIHWGIHMKTQSGMFGLSVAGDYHLFEKRLVNDANFNFFFGVGANASFIISDDTTSIFMGGRIPIGVYYMPVEFFEVFLNVAPTLGLFVNPTSFPEGFMGLDLGVRFWM